MNPDERSELCWHARTADVCHDKASVHTNCAVEGTDIHLCQRHYGNWVRLIQQDPRLKGHCPRCATAYLERLESQAHNPAVSIADEPISGPLAEAIDEAMHAEGILKPTRDRVLRRLAANTDAYVAAVMSRNAGTYA